MKIFISTLSLLFLSQGAFAQNSYNLGKIGASDPNHIELENPKPEVKKKSKNSDVLKNLGKKNPSYVGKKFHKKVKSEK